MHIFASAAIALLCDLLENPDSPDAPSIRDEVTQFISKVRRNPSSFVRRGLGTCWLNRPRRGLAPNFKARISPPLYKLSSTSSWTNTHNWSGLVVLTPRRRDGQSRRFTTSPYGYPLQAWIQISTTRTETIPSCRILNGKLTASLRVRSRVCTILLMDRRRLGFRVK